MKREGEYKKWTFGDVGRIVGNLGSEISSLGISRGDRVAILSENRPEWSMSYLAIGSMGAVTVPLDALLSAPDHLGLINDSGAKGLIVSEKFLNDLRARKAEMPSLRFIISMDLPARKDEVLSFPEIAGRPSGKHADFKVDQDDLLSILYTSGTTGVAKGVMLTHKNITTNVVAVAEVFKMLGPGDNFLSVLPIHHTFETTAGFIAPYYIGCTITYAESLKSYSILANMKETGVSVMCGVPLLHKIFFEGIMRNVEEKGPAAKVLFGILFATSKAVKFLTGKNIGRKLFSMVHRQLGGRTRFWVSGGAAIDPGILRGFDYMGLTILQGYGLTESSPILTCCTLDDNKLGSVGKAIRGVTLAISNPDEKGAGEIIAKGPNIMKGYYKRPDITAEMVRDGWLYTGDLGYIDKKGYVYITGRLKDVIITGSGLNVYPEEVEKKLDRSPLISESCVLGRKVKEGLRKGMEEPIALIIPKQEYFQKFAEGRGVKVDSDLIKKEMKAEIDRINKMLPEHERVASYMIWEADFPKTSTRKIKRFALRKQLGLA